MGIPQIGTCGAAALAYGSSREEVVEIRRQSRPTLIPRGRVLFWEGEHQPQKIKIVEGVIRAVRLLENGTGKSCFLLAGRRGHAHSIIM